MSRMRSEFLASFWIYVRDDADSRADLLRKFLTDVDVDNIVGMVEPFDLAAMMTVAVHVDPTQPLVQRLALEVSEWEEACKKAEDDFEDPRAVTMDPHVDDIPINIDPKFEDQAKSFFSSVLEVESGRSYAAVLIACLAWAHEIQAVRINLWSPKKGKED